MWKKYREATRYESSSIKEETCYLSQSIILYAELKMFTKVAELCEKLAIYLEK